MVAVSLLDINVLLALAWPTHVHHAAAHRWFSGSASLAWASCPLTQLGFVRLSMQPAVVREEIRARVAGHQQRMLSCSIWRCGRRGGWRRLTGE